MSTARDYEHQNEFELKTRVTDQNLNPQEGEVLTDFVKALLVLPKHVTPDRNFTYERVMLEEYNRNSIAAYDAWHSDALLCGEEISSYEDSPYFYDLESELIRLEKEEINYNQDMKDYQAAKWTVDDAITVVRGIAGLTHIGRKLIAIYDIIENSLKFYAYASEHLQVVDIESRIGALRENLNYMKGENERLNDHRILNGQEPVIWETTDLYKSIVSIINGLQQQKTYVDTLIGFGAYTFSQIQKMLNSELFLVI